MPPVVLSHLFDAFAAALADTVASVAQGASVNGGRAPLAGLGQMSFDGDVRRDALAQVMHETSLLSDGGQSIDALDHSSCVRCETMRASIIMPAFAKKIID